MIKPRRNQNSEKMREVREMKKVKRMKEMKETRKAQKEVEFKKFRNQNNYIGFFVFLCLFSVNPSQAKNIGVWGTTFPVVEQDIKEFIYSRLNQMQQNGKLEKLKKVFIRNVKQHTLRPPPVEGLTSTDQPKKFYYDPTYILNRNIEDEKGRIIAKAGTIINPLEIVRLHGVLFFINADDKRQIKWALKNVKKYDYVKYILVCGNIKDAGKVLNDRIYFDQYGLMTRKLGIKHIPCIVKQEGKKLQIQEFALKEEANKEAK